MLVVRLKAYTTLSDSNYWTLVQNSEIVKAISQQTTLHVPAMFIHDNRYFYFWDGEQYNIDYQKRLNRDMSLSSAIQEFSYYTDYLTDDGIPALITIDEMNAVCYSDLYKIAGVKT